MNSSPQRPYAQPPDDSIQLTQAENHLTHARSSVGQPGDTHAGSTAPSSRCEELLQSNDTAVREDSGEESWQNDIQAADDDSTTDQSPTDWDDWTKDHHSESTSDAGDEYKLRQAQEDLTNARKWGKQVAERFLHFMAEHFESSYGSAFSQWFDRSNTDSASCLARYRLNKDWRSPSPPSPEYRAKLAQEASRKKSFGEAARPQRPILLEHLTRSSGVPTSSHCRTQQATAKTEKSARRAYVAFDSLRSRKADELTQRRNAAGVLWRQPSRLRLARGPENEADDEDSSRQIEVSHQARHQPVEIFIPAIDVWGTPCTATDFTNLPDRSLNPNPQVLQNLGVRKPASGILRPIATGPQRDIDWTWRYGLPSASPDSAGQHATAESEDYANEVQEAVCGDSGW